MNRRVFLIVCDSFGVGELPDAALYGDAGSNTLRAVRKNPRFFCPTLTSLGLLTLCGEPLSSPRGAYGKAAEQSAGKDTTTGHWELAGLISPTPFPTYPNGFPEEILAPFRAATGRGILCNKPYSGTEVIKDYGEEHLKTGELIVYTSADSVFQIAAHEDIVSPETLYEYCRIARNLLTGKHAVGRVIARPFAGEYPFYRTPRRHDFSVLPPADTMLDLLKKSGLDVIAVGKIYDIFAGRGITESYLTTDNADGMDKVFSIVKKDFHGLCFVNLVDFDMKFGHRNDVDGYANALSEFDARLADFLPLLKTDDLLIVTADHGCDPSTPSTDHSREYVPVLLYGASVTPAALGTLPTFADISATVLDYLGVDKENTTGESMLRK